MIKNSLGAVMLKNSICVVCWAALAVVFDRWWIALFALLFMTSYETVQRHFRICDKCGKRSEPASGHNEALDKAREAGWIHIAEDNKDYCQNCKHEVMR